MYDKLIAALRETDFGYVCEHCEHEDMCRNNDCVIIQAADAIEKMQVDYDDAIHAIETLDESNDRLLKENEKLQTMIDANKWISVNEALPEVGDVVLAMGKRHATTGQFQGIGSKPCYWWWKGRTIKEVTHWRPLPPPPIEGD